MPYAYNRKEAKDHGEGGHLVGAPVRGRVLIVDDVMSAGTAARESIALIHAAGATPHAVAIALDRQEKATEDGRDVDHSAVQYVQRQLGLQVCAIARLADLLQYLQRHAGDELGQHHAKVLAYREALRRRLKPRLLSGKGPRPVRNRAFLLVSLLAAAWCCEATAQARGPVRIYSCIDAKGRRLTSDRPIMECLDREQTQYGDRRHGARQAAAVADRR